MNIQTTILVKILICLLFACGAFKLGQVCNQAEIENRALKMNKECYSGTDLGYIIKAIPQP